MAEIDEAAADRAIKLESESAKKEKRKPKFETRIETITVVAHHRINPTNVQMMANIFRAK